MSKLYFTSLFSIALAFVIFAYYLILPVQTANASFSLKPEDKAIILLGKNIYAQNCASCHGINLEGQKDWMSRLPNGMMPAPPHDVTGHTWHHADNYLFLITKYGFEEILGEKYPNNMPKYKDILSDKEIIAALSYIKSTWSSKTQKIHDQINLKSNKK